MQPIYVYVRFSRTFFLCVCLFFNKHRDLLTHTELFYKTFKKIVFISL